MSFTLILQIIQHISQAKEGIPILEFDARSPSLLHPKVHFVKLVSCKEITEHHYFPISSCECRKLWAQKRKES